MKKRIRNYSGLGGLGKIAEKAEKFKITVLGEKNEIIVACGLTAACRYATLNYGSRWSVCERIKGEDKKKA